MCARIFIAELFLVAYKWKNWMFMEGLGEIMKEWIDKLGFPDSSVGKESSCNGGDRGAIPGSGRSPGEGIGYPLQYSWVSLVAQLINRIHLQCRRPGFDPWVGKIPWRREKLLTPVFWPGELHGLYSPWGCKESDMTESLFYTSIENKSFFFNK